MKEWLLRVIVEMDAYKATLAKIEVYGKSIGLRNNIDVEGCNTPRDDWVLCVWVTTLRYCGHCNIHSEIEWICPAFSCSLACYTRSFAQIGFRKQQPVHQSLCKNKA